MSNTAELLIEVFSEEIPARMQEKAASDLQDQITKRLKDAGLAFANAVSHSTPRRLVVVIDSLETEQADREEEKKGPKVGAPEQALSGFMKANGLASIDEAEQRDTGKGLFYFAVKSIKGQPASAILPALIADAINAIPWPKSMRWGRGTLRAARPIHSVIALFGGDVVEGELKLSDTDAIVFGNTTRGHRFMAPDEFSVTDFATYEQKLMDSKVMLDRDTRQQAIEESLTKLAAEKAITPIADKGLMSEIVGLVEWPVPIMGRIEDEFMEVPMEVLVTSMKEHQKFFAFKNTDDSLAPFFATVANTEPHDDGELICSGNERVLRARLSDAKFFWDQDKKTPLGDNVPKLSSIVFHAKLGTVGDKIDRMGPLASEIAGIIGADRDKARSAARLAKADLVSNMVYEFPELQGTMGRYYALNDGESTEVADAIAEHYSPLGPQDACPSAPVSVSVALADKLDTLVGFWLIDEKPTGSKDPFALRRAALGVTRLITENNHHISLKSLIDHATKAYGDKATSDITDDLWSFFKDRIKVSLRDLGIRHDVIDALYASDDDDDVTRLFAKAKSLSAALDTEDGKAMVAGYKRAANIVNAEEKKEKATYRGNEVDGSLFVQDEEKNLDAAITEALNPFPELMAANRFEEAYRKLAALRPAIDAFFDKVMVNDETPNIRQNRLNLVARLKYKVEDIADLSKLEG